MILRRLRRAAAPGTPMAAMTLYDPFLELYLTPGGHVEALTSVRYARVTQPRARTPVPGSRLPRRARRQRVSHLRHLPHATLAGQSAPVPVAVAEVCRLTWMCAPGSRGAEHPRQPRRLPADRRAFLEGLRLAGRSTNGQGNGPLFRHQSKVGATPGRTIGWCSRALRHEGRGTAPGCPPSTHAPARRPACATSPGRRSWTSCSSPTAPRVRRRRRSSARSSNSGRRG